MSASAEMPRAGAVASWRSLGRGEQLARRAVAGDRRAFEALFKRYHQELYRYCRAIVTHAEDAEDAVQATMVKALRALPGETREIALRPWLYRVAHNEAISILRSRREAVELEPAELAASTTVETTAEMREQVRTLVGDLATLPERQRASLVMRELSDLSYEEIGDALAMSPAAARQAVYEARTALASVAEGREMDCARAREAISIADRRVLRGRKLSAHLRGCERCRDFEAAIRDRRATLAALAPPLAAPAALALLHGALGAGSVGSAGTVGAGTVGAGLAGSAAAKTAAAVLAVAAIGGGAASVGVLDSADRDREGSRDRTPAEAPAVAPAAPAADVASGAPVSRAAPPRGSGGGRDSSASDSPGAMAGGQPQGAGNSAEAPGHTGEAVSAGAPATAPGHSEEAPGQSAQVPGQAHSNAGGGGKSTAPGQTGASPGNSESAPGHSASAPSAASPPTPSSQGNAVGHAAAPGQNK